MAPGGTPRSKELYVVTRICSSSTNHPDLGADQRPDVAVMSYSTALGSGASIAQQIHTIIRWRDIKIDQHQHALDNLGNAELIIAGQSQGLDLVLFYIRKRRNRPEDGVRID